MAQVHCSDYPRERCEQANARNRETVDRSRCVLPLSHVEALLPLARTFLSFGNLTARHQFCEAVSARDRHVSAFTGASEHFDDAAARPLKRATLGHSRGSVDWRRQAE
jgi:hypothetical protein